MLKTTEKDSNYRHLEKMSTNTILTSINLEDQTVPIAISKKLKKIETLVDVITDRLLSGGRLFYIGAGTSGRLGIVDASECPPTFGVPHELVIGLMAGGDSAMRKAVEFAEDDHEGGWNDLLKFNINSKDIVVGIAASGTTPYVIGALEHCNESNIVTGSISCNEGSPLSKAAKYPIEIVVGPEFVTGSTRMKSGTAQKLVLNMLSTATMIKLGRVKDNKMIDMHLSNKKLIARGIKMIVDQTSVEVRVAAELLQKYGSVIKAVKSLN